MLHLAGDGEAAGHGRRDPEPAVERLERDRGGSSLSLSSFTQKAG
jgi:hypothetical protein